MPANQPNNQVHIAVMLLWASVALGVMNIALHGLLNYRASGQLGATSPLIISAAFFIFVQARLITRLQSGNAAIRARLAIITALRVFTVVLTLHLYYAIMPALVLLPGIAGALQVAALGLVFFPPGSAYFARPAAARR
jgi:hypothetical protein